MAKDSADNLGVLSLELYFSDLVDQSVQRQSFVISPDTRFYVVSLLCNFASSDSLFEVDPHNGQRQREALALLKARAEAAPERQRVSLLKRLGDSSLYISGFFRESLQRSLVGLDYYASMGGGAYSSLSDMLHWQQRQRVYGKIYAELASKFAELVRVLTWVARETSGSKSSDRAIVRMYDNWQRTGDVEVEKKLRKQGIPLHKLIKEPGGQQ